ncbi:EAL domain-containing protein [Thalassolituus marinus]|uniref:EAL domain-containing protein n=1 Tax=Thalassolituus marinus TaxID=671053 RepID=UPI00298CD3C4|nr:EAL domain-containing protein [Thalassolituus marinus]
MAHTSGADREHKVGSDNLCDACRGNTPLDFDFHMVFQPIFDASGRTVFAHEALVRGPQGQGAGWVFGFVNDGNLYQFDQACRTKAIQQAAQLNINSLLSINFLPNAVYRPELCIRRRWKRRKPMAFP